LAFRFLLELRTSPMSPQISVAPATSQKRIEANRRNAQKSTGPRTTEGKSRSRFNGLKHGLTASVPVIPGEDPAAYQARVEAMIRSSPPRNQVELDLLGRVAATTWSLERAARAEAAQISHRIRNEAVERERRQEEKAVALGQRLLWDARGPWQAYPHHPHTGQKWERRTSWSEDPADGNSPALVLLRLERTVAGCRWLLERWAELGARLEPGEVWTSTDQFKAFRLLGKQPLDAVDDADVTLICLACAKIAPDGDDDDGEAFTLIEKELRKHTYPDFDDQHKTYSREIRKRPLARLRPADADTARQALRALVDRQTARLKLILARNREIAEADAAEAPDRLAFDPSPEGEKLRRYSLSAARLANQTIKTFLSVVRGPWSVATEGSGAGLEIVGRDARAREMDEGDPFAERKATMTTMSAGEASPEKVRSEANALSAMAQPEPGPLDSPTSGSPNSHLAPPGRGPDSMSGVRGSERGPEAATAALRTEPNAPPAQPKPGPLNSRTSGSPNSHLAPPGRGPDSMSGVRASETVPGQNPPSSVLRTSSPLGEKGQVRGSERGPEAATAPLRTEANAPPAQPEPESLNSRTSGSPNFPLAPPGRGPDSMSGVRGSEKRPEATATTTLRTEPSTPLARWQPRSPLTAEPIPDGEEASELAQLNRYRAVLHSLISPIEWPEMPPAKRTKPSSSSRKQTNRRHQK
jgi:hypothetical protein